MDERTAEPCIDVFLCAESRLLREALAKVLGKKNGIRVVGAGAYDGEIAGRIAKLAPHVVVVGSDFFACTGVEVMVATRRSLPGVKILMIGMVADEEIFLRCVHAGIAGFVLQEASACEIAGAVRDIAYEGAVCPPVLCQALFDSVARQCASVPQLRRGAHLGLTRREQQLAQMISGGLTNKEIAAQLNLSEQTIKNHVHRILRKLGTPDRVGAADLCRHYGVVV